MTMPAPTWFEHEPHEQRRWAIAAAVVVGVHAAAIFAYSYVPRPQEIGDDSAPISIDFSPGTDTVDQAAIEPTPEPPPPQQVEQPPPPPPPPPQAVALPEPPPPAKVEEQQPEQQPQPSRVKGGSPRIKETFKSAVARHLAQHVIAYPRSAVARDQHGLVEVTFSVDHDGHVHDLEVTHSSGHSELDQAALSMVIKAQPYPALPPGLEEDDNIFTFPLNFALQ
jgi:protein TonB